LPIEVAIGAIASLGGAFLTSSATDRAAQAQLDASAAGRDTILQMYNQTREDTQDFRDVGRGAVTSLAQLYGLPTEANPEGGEAFSEGAVTQFERSPDYAYAFDEGRRAREASAASRGMLQSGAMQRELTEYGQGMASSNFGNYVRTLLNLAGIGTNAANQTANVNMNTGSQLADLSLAGGEATASGIVGSNNALSTGLEGFTSALSAFRPTPSSFGATSSLPSSYNPATASQGFIY